MKKLSTDERWNLMLENGISTEEIMQVVTDINGYTNQALDDIFDVTTEWHTFEDWYEDMYGEE